MKSTVGSNLIWCASVCSAMGLAWVTGCDGLEPTPPEEARLAGDWTTTDENGEPVAIRFDDQGQLQGVVTRDALDDVIVIVIDESTTTVVGDDVTVEVSTANGAVVFTGVLSADDNTLTGSLTQAIEVSDEITVVIPEGERELSRVTDAACFLVECPDGESCVDGMCVADNSCNSTVCTNGEECVDGQCVSTDPCADVVCSNGEECVDGQCATQDLCADVVCSNGEMCVDGACEPEENDMGDEAAGQAFYQPNGCAGCNAGNELSDIVPSLSDITLASMFTNLNGADTYPAMVDNITPADAEDLVVFTNSAHLG